MKIYGILILSLFTLFGCTGKDEAAQQQNQQHVINVKNSTVENVDAKTGQEISKHLVEIASSIPNINDATAVVLGEYAIVGIDVNQDLDRSEVGSLKYSVAESLKHDPHGANAIVVADPDINSRLKEIREDIQNGEPIQGIINELADMAGRLMPEVPADLIDPKPTNVTEDPKKQLNTTDQQNLEQYQQQQSNFKK